MLFVSGLLVVQLLKAHGLQVTKLETQEPPGKVPFKQTLKNFMDMSYSAEMKIGKTKMDVILDTGSFDVEVMSKRCGHACQGAGSIHYYDRETSSEYVEGDLLHLTSYGSGDVYAQSGADTVAFTGASGELTIPNQQFWEVVYADLGGLLESGDFEAIVGVGPPSIDLEEIEYEAQEAEDLIRIFHDLKLKVPEGFCKQRYIAEVPKMKTVVEMLETKRFSICLGWKPGSPGHFIWDDVDPSAKPAFQQLDMAGKITWGLKLSNVMMKQGGSNDLSVGCMGSHTCAAIVDSGTSLLTVPTDVYNSLYDHLVSLNASCDHMDRLPSFAFELGGKTLTLPPSSYIGYVEDNWMQKPQTPNARFFPFLNNQTFSLSRTRGPKTCELLIGKMDLNTTLGPMWILGMPFFRKYYTTFELGVNQRDSESRKMFVAEADDRCEPSASGLDATKSNNHPITVTPKHLRVPKWAVKALKKGSLKM